MNENVTKHINRKDEEVLKTHFKNIHLIKMSRFKFNYDNDVTGRFFHPIQAKRKLTYYGRFRSSDFFFVFPQQLSMLYFRLCNS